MCKPEILNKCIMVKFIILSFLLYCNLEFLIFFQECPGGIVQEETFKEIYAKFFPHGSKYKMGMWVRRFHSKYKITMNLKIFNRVIQFLNK